MLGVGSGSGVPSSQHSSFPSYRFALSTCPSGICWPKLWGQTPDHVLGSVGGYRTGGPTLLDPVSVVRECTCPSTFLSVLAGSSVPGAGISTSPTYLKSLPKRMGVMCECCILVLRKLRWVWALHSELFYLHLFWKGGLLFASMVSAAMGLLLCNWSIESCLVSGSAKGRGHIQPFVFLGFRLELPKKVGSCAHLCSFKDFGNWNSQKI